MKRKNEELKMSVIEKILAILDGAAMDIDAGDIYAEAGSDIGRMWDAWTESEMGTKAEENTAAALAIACEKAVR